MKKQISIGEIFRRYGQEYILNNSVKGQEKGIINLLSSCRTEDLGKHYQCCNQCGHTEIVNNSCRNRHCPVCQQKDKEQWLEKRMQELLPVGYYHLVFTIPAQLNPVCLQNKKVMYDILFRAASQTIIELAKDPKYLGACTGMMAVLHTWGQNMMEHPHLHVIMPAGGLSFDKSHWIHIGNKDEFFVPYKAISRKFRGKFLDYFNQAVSKKELVFKGNCKERAGKNSFNRFKDKLYKKEWVVNIQSPFACPEKVLEYLSRYVFRIAITDRGITKISNHSNLKVNFWPVLRINVTLVA